MKMEDYKDKLQRQARAGAPVSAPARAPPRAGGLVLPPGPVVQPKLPPGWSEERHIYNLKTGEPLAGRGFVTYHSPGGSLYRTIAASWKTFRSRELLPHLNDHWAIMSLGQDPDRCVLQPFVGSAAVEHVAAPAAAALRVRSAQRMASQQLEDDHRRHGERVTDAGEVPAVGTVDSEWSRASATPSASHAPVEHVSPLRLRHRAEHVLADSLPSDSVVLWRPGHTDTVTPPAIPRNSDSASR